MKEIKYTYKFRLKPTKDQEVLLNKHFGSVRDFNAAINILNEGCRKNISGGTSDYKRRAKIRPFDGTGVEALKENTLI